MTFGNEKMRIDQTNNTKSECKQAWEAVSGFLGLKNMA